MCAAVAFETCQKELNAARPADGARRGVLEVGTMLRAVRNLREEAETLK